MLFLQKIDSNTDIAYSVSASGGGGLVKSRDFVNLRCWRLIRNSKIVENYNINSSISKFSLKSHSSDGDNENSSDDEDNDNHNKSNDNNENRKKVFKVVNEKSLKKSTSVDNVINGVNNTVESNEPFHLSKSLGAKEIIMSEDDDEPYSDAQTEIQQNDGKNNTVNNLDNCIYVSAAMSIDYALYPPTSKYIRGDNIVSCWAMRHVPNEPENCIFEWLMCIDLKGSLPKYVLNTAFTSLMTDYMVHLRSRIQQLNDENINNQCA